MLAEAVSIIPVKISGRVKQGQQAISQYANRWAHR